jgi:hypothetical protein
MFPNKFSLAIASVAAIGFASVVSLAMAQSPAPSTAPSQASSQASSQDVSELGNNEGIYVDSKTFTIARGKAKNDPTPQLEKLGAKQMAPGAVIFRSGDKLYIVENMPEPTPQALKDFQDNLPSYMTAMKNFQDQWSNYMKDPRTTSASKNFQDQWADYMKNPDFASSAKNFQDQWSNYMNSGKNFQDQWASYMNGSKNFQDQWSNYMNATKDFQDNWAVGYMK